MNHTAKPQQKQPQQQEPAQAARKANVRAGAKHENCINSETAVIYRIAKNDTTQRESEDRLISDALAILDGRIKRGESLTDPKQAANYCKVRLQHLEHEVFLVLFLDTRHRVIASEEMFRGTIDSSQIHPREVAKRALELNASAVIFAHNHPSGNSEPSSADCTVTESLKKALALLEIRVLDHFVVGDGVPVSFAEKGWM